ncbi:MAG: DNA-processing protein DprA [Solirubrobacteraceae bacterium]|jgi:DNA processing protein
MSCVRACGACLARSWLLERLASHLEPVRARIADVLDLEDRALIDAVAGAHADAVAKEFVAFDASAARAQANAAGLELICRCDPGYPRRLLALPQAPAVLHVAGGLDRFLRLAAADPVAVIGSRHGSTYGAEVARSLGRALASAGVTVLSGMALGIDSAAHAGALKSNGPTVAVLAAGAQRAYPPSKRALHAQIRSTGATVSELPGAAGVWRWMFPARNRLIAGLSAMTVVVEAREHSGALVTAGFARSLGRPVGAVPGRVTAAAAEGSNALLADGAYVVRGAQDVLDLLFGAGVRAAPSVTRPALAPELEALLAAIADGHDTAGALERAGFPAEQGLAALASLELAGYIRREAGGRFGLTAA